jgi:hypothetical protein
MVPDGCNPRGEGLHERAVAAYGTGLGLEPGNAPAWFQEGLSLVALNAKERSRRLFGNGIALTKWKWILGSSSSRRSA